jgi:nitrite reductase (NAD(P)H)
MCPVQLILLFHSLETSIPDIFAIGDCASWENITFGIIAPGIEMADVLSYNLTRMADQSLKLFNRPDFSTKLKLLGVDVASFGDFFADRDGPKSLPESYKLRLRPNETTSPPVKALTYKDPFGAVYKKYLFTPDGRFLLGGMMIGDTNDYARLNQMVRNQKPLETPPSEFILGVQKNEPGDVDDL